MEDLNMAHYKISIRRRQVLTRSQGPPAEKYAHNIQRYNNLYTWGTFYPCVHQTHLVCLLPKSSFFV